MSLPWDQDVIWREEVSTPPTASPVDLTYIEEKVLRVLDDGYGSDYIQALIAAATEAAEQDTGRALMPQTRKLYLDKFPTEAGGEIVLPGPPLIAVTNIVYVDSAGDEQTLTGSPAEFQIIASGRHAKAKLLPLAGTSWPTAREQPDAVVVTYQCGYADADTVPAIIRAGIGVMVGEMYKLRSLSVHEVHNTPSVLQLRRFWRKVYG